jgi:Ser/Thr protein kinase RdoA (MazF antagonist)
MMNTDIMRQLVAEAESGTKEMPTATRAAGFWGFDKGSLFDFRYSANAIYTFKQQGTRRFMRLTWTGDRSVEQLEAELDYLIYLKRSGFPVAGPIESRGGNLVENVSNSYGEFNAVTFSESNGVCLDIAELTDAQLKAWGRLVARLHTSARAYQPSTEFQRPGWEQVIERYASWLPVNMPYAKKYLDEAVIWLQTLPTTPSHYGLIHWDFEPDNITWQGTDIEVFDFDDAAYFWFPADIAFAFDSVLEEKPESARHIIAQFLTGYSDIDSLDTHGYESLYLFIRLMRVFKTARIIHAYADTHPEMDPPWLAELRERHKRQVQVLEQGFREPFKAPRTAEEVAIWG